MRLIRGFITAIGIIGILFIIALIMGYYLFCLTPPIKAKMAPAMPSAEAAESFNQKFETFEAEIEAAVDAGEEREVSLAITEQEVNNKMLDVLAEGELPLKSVLINFGDGHFLAYVVVENPGVSAKTGVLAQIKVVDGGLKIAVEDFDLGKLPLPQSAKNGVGELLTIMVRLKLTDLPLEITNVEISNHKLTVVGSTKAAD